MSNLNSYEVKVFPYSEDRVADPLGADLNEANLRILMTAGSDSESYVISYNNNMIEFVLAGYYFKVKNVSTLNFKPLFASIKLGTDDYSVLGSEDSSGRFTPLEFTKYKPTDPTSKWIQILDEYGKVPEDSKYKIDRSSVKLYWKNL